VYFSASERANKRNRKKTPMSESLRFAKIKTKVPSHHRTTLFDDYLTKGQREVYGVVLFSFTAPLSGRMVAFADLMFESRGVPGEYGLLPIEEEFVEIVDTIPRYNRNRLLLMMTLVGDIRQRITETGSRIDEEDVEVELLRLLYKEYVDELNRSLAECATEEMREHIRKFDARRMKKAREVIAAAESNHRASLVVELLETRNELCRAQRSISVRRQAILQKMADIRASRSADRCEVSLLFTLHDDTAHVEYIDRKLLQVHKSSVALFDDDTLHFTITNNTVKHMETVNDLVSLLYLYTLPTSVRSLTEIIPLLVVLGCAPLYTLCIDKLCSLSGAEDLWRLCVLARMLGDGLNEKLSRRALELLRTMLDKSEFCASLTSLLYTWNLHCPSLEK